MHYNAYGAFYTQCSHQYVSAAAVAIVWVVILLKEYKVQMCVIYWLELVVGDMWTVWYTGWN